MASHSSNSGHSTRELAVTAEVQSVQQLTPPTVNQSSIQSGPATEEDCHLQTGSGHVFQDPAEHTEPGDADQQVSPQTQAVNNHFAAPPQASRLCVAQPDDAMDNEHVTVSAAADKENCDVSTDSGRTAEQCEPLPDSTPASGG